MKLPVRYLLLLVACSSREAPPPDKTPPVPSAPRTWKSFSVLGSTTLRPYKTEILPNGRVVFRDLDEDNIDMMVDATPELLAFVDRVVAVGPSESFGGFAILEGGGNGPPDLEAERRLHVVLDELAKKPRRLVPCPDIRSGTFGARVVDAKRVFHVDDRDAWTKPFGPHSRSDHPDVAPVTRLHVPDDSAEALRTALLALDLDGPAGPVNVELWTTTTDRCGRKLAAADVVRVVDRIVTSPQ